MKLNDIPEEQLQLAEITSKYGYEIYQKAKEDFENDIDKMMNSLESSLIYFIGNEIHKDDMESLCEIICQSLKNNVSRLKKHKDSEDKEYLFSQELRDRMSKFGDRPLEYCLSDPNFYDSLLDHAGLTQKEKDKIWDKIKDK